MSKFVLLKDDYLDLEKLAEEIQKAVGVEWWHQFEIPYPDFNTGAMRLERKIILNILKRALS